MYKEQRAEEQLQVVPPTQLLQVEQERLPSTTDLCSSVAVAAIPP